MITNEFNVLNHFLALAAIYHSPGPCHPPKWNRVRPLSP
jgi:hypothetical protein